MIKTETIVKRFVLQDPTIRAEPVERVESSEFIASLRNERGQERPG